MPKSTLFAVALLLVILCACATVPEPITPTVTLATLQPTGAPTLTPPRTPTIAPTKRPTRTPSPTPQPPDLIRADEPLRIMGTEPTQNSTQVSIKHPRIAVRFSRPVVPAGAVNQPNVITQPLTIHPAVPVTGSWSNAFTYVMTPTQELDVATQYTVTVEPIQDTWGNRSEPFSWAFQTITPRVVSTEPRWKNRSQVRGPMDRIAITFNVEMDRGSVENRLRVMRQADRWAALGSFQWDKSTVSFIPTYPLDHGTAYVVELVKGAQDVKRIGTTDAISFTFRTFQPFAVTATAPHEGEQQATVLRDGGGLVLYLTQPIDVSNYQLTIDPPIANTRITTYEDTSPNYASRVVVSGRWRASTEYTVILGRDTRSVTGERLSGDTIIHFKTAPLEPALDLSLPVLGLYDANGPQTIYATIANIERIDFELYRVPGDDFLQLAARSSNNLQANLTLYLPEFKNLYNTWSVSPKQELNDIRVITTTLKGSFGAKPAPGIYLLRATAPEMKGFFKRIILISPHNLALKFTQEEALVWVTEMSSGKPVANQAISIYSTGGTTLAEGRSDQDGVFYSKLNWSKGDARKRIIVQSLDDAGNIISAVASDWTWGISPSDYGIAGAWNVTGQKIKDNLYTDRAVYRAGQTVYFKGVVRRMQDPRPGLPWEWKEVSEKRDAPQERVGLTQIETTILNSRGEEILKQSLPVNEFGTIHGQVALNENAPTGEYSIVTDYGSVSFMVAEYRKPEFQVNVSTNQPEYLNGDAIHLKMDSSYFFGGPVTGARVTWRVLAEPSFPRPNVEGGWEFSDTPHNDDDSTQNAEQIRNGQGETDASGVFTVMVPAELGEYASSQNLILEAEVVDVNHQSVAGRVTVPVHKGAFYLGLWARSYVGGVNKTQAVDLIALKSVATLDGSSPLPNQPVSVSFYEGRWYNVRELENGLYAWRSTYTETLLSRTDTMTNEQGRATVSFSPTHAGEYRITAESRDSRGNLIKSATRLYVYGSGYVGWKIDNTNRISLVADKKEYAPGDIAELMILAPFADSEALLTIERSGVIEARRFHIRENTGTIRIPIVGDYAPNVFASVMLVKGRGQDSSIPQFKMGYVKLGVKKTAQTLHVQLSARCSAPIMLPTRASLQGQEELAADDHTCQPNDTVTLSIHATDYLNHPARAEFSVSLVDKAVQSLLGDTSVSLLATFYQEYGLAVRTGTTLIYSIERENQPLRTGAKGGGGGTGSDPVIRNDFRDTAFWNPTVFTDKEGNAQVSVKLPDNLATWNFAVKGITFDTRVGLATTDIISTRPLLIRPVAPRFFVVGDSAILEAIVNNNTDETVTARVSLVAQGLSVRNDTTQVVTIPAHDKRPVRWEAATEFVDQVILTFSATSGTLRDGVELKLPSQLPQTTEALFAVEPVEERLSKLLRLDPDVTQHGASDTLEVRLTPSLAAASREALDYLDSYSWECSEQTTSKFLPNIATYLALERLGLARQELFFQLQSNVSREIQRLYFLQHGDGGWGWWRDGSSRPALTAYALFALATARGAGFAVDESVMKRAEVYLNDWLDKPVDASKDYALNERAFTLYVLTEMGRDTQGRVVNAYENRAGLDNFAKAFLLLAMHRHNLPQQTELVQELNGAARIDHRYVRWTEEHVDSWNMNTDTRTQAIVVLALARVDPTNELLPRAISWLMDARKLEYHAVHWDTTQETAWGVMALTEWMAATGELEGDYSYQVVMNGKLLGAGQVNPTKLDQSRTIRISIRDAFRESANELLVTRDTLKGSLYTSAYLRQYVDPSTLPPITRGILLQRVYYAVDPLTLKPTSRQVHSARVGDYVQVRIIVVLQANTHYLALEDPLPAGFEAVDTSLQTASSALQGVELNSSADSITHPYWWYWGHSEIRDDRVAVFADWIENGTYEYSYVMRARAYCKLIYGLSYPQ